MSRTRWFQFFLLGALASSGVATANPANSGHSVPRDPKQALQAGAAFKLCLDCHKPFAPKVERRSVHPLIQRKDCTGCHDAHASDHGGLLVEDKMTLCKRCHDPIAGNRVVHEPLMETGCRSCHDSHASDVPPLLKKAGRALCADCHEEVTSAAAKASHPHDPIIQGGCTKDCHDPHASKVKGPLLRQPIRKLCIGCHAPESFEDKHSGFSMENSDCIDCHDAHGSNRPGMLYDDIHAPIAKGACGDCHQPPSPGQPAALTAAGRSCRSCHETWKKKLGDKTRVHWPVEDAVGCANCHDPHGSSSPMLVKPDLDRVCGSCHSDTLLRHDNSPTKHEPVLRGECSTCHDPHGSDLPLAVRTGDVCAECHDWRKHSSHPIGPKLVDQRNPNLTLDCASCHRAHGTEFPHMMTAPLASVLCTQCHKEFKR